MITNAGAPITDSGGGGGDNSSASPDDSAGDDGSNTDVAPPKKDAGKLLDDGLAKIKDVWANHKVLISGVAVVFILSRSKAVRKHFK